MNRKSTGFTIVELIVVIVVIGILAAITIVSYRGIQQEARNKAVIHDAQQWMRFLTVMYTREGTIYIDDLPSGTSSLCLGTRAHYPETPQLEEGQCWHSGWTSDKLEEKMAKIGNISMTTYTTDNGSTPGRGLIYQQLDSNSAVINYDLQGEGEDCSVVEGGYAHNPGINGLTECRAKVEDVVGGMPIVYR